MLGKILQGFLIISSAQFFTGASNFKIILTHNLAWYIKKKSSCSDLINKFMDPHFKVNISQQHLLCSR